MRMWLIGVTIDEKKALESCLAFHVAYPAMTTVDMIARRREEGKLFCSQFEEQDNPSSQSLIRPYRKDSRLRIQSATTIAHIPGEILSQIRLCTYDVTLSWICVLMSNPSFPQRGVLWVDNQWYSQWIQPAGSTPPEVGSMTPSMLVQRCLEHWGLIAVFDFIGHERPSRPALTITARPFQSTEDSKTLAPPDAELKKRFREMMDVLILKPIAKRPQM
jgi:hypothetical protein